MRTKPRPSKMFFISGTRGHRIHLGFYQATTPRPLCGAKLSGIESRIKIFKKKKTNMVDGIAANKLNIIFSSTKFIKLNKYASVGFFGS